MPNTASTRPRAAELLTGVAHVAPPEQHNIPTAQSRTTELLTSEQAAQELGFRETTLRLWRCAGKGPKFLKFGRSVRYRRRDLLSFIEQHAAA